MKVFWHKVEHLNNKEDILSNIDDNTNWTPFENNEKYITELQKYTIPRDGICDSSKVKETKFDYQYCSIWIKVSGQEQDDNTADTSMLHDKQDYYGKL